MKCDEKGTSRYAVKAQAIIRRRFLNDRTTRKIVFAKKIDREKNGKGSLCESETEIFYFLTFYNANMVIIVLDRLLNLYDKSFIIILDVIGVFRQIIFIIL